MIKNLLGFTFLFVSFGLKNISQRKTRTWTHGNKISNNPSSFQILHACLQRRTRCSGRYISPAWLSGGLLRFEYACPRSSSRERVEVERNAHSTARHLSVPVQRLRKCTLILAIKEQTVRGGVQHWQQLYDGAGCREARVCSQSSFLLVFLHRKPSAQTAPHPCAPHLSVQSACV